MSARRRRRRRLTDSRCTRLAGVEGDGGHAASAPGAAGAGPDRGRPAGRQRGRYAHGSAGDQGGAHRYPGAAGRATRERAGRARVAAAALVRALARLALRQNRPPLQETSKFSAERRARDEGRQHERAAGAGAGRPVPAAARAALLVRAAALALAPGVPAASAAPADPARPGPLL